ncbi:YtrH family sporulation protein [Bacillus sp. CGMCC 1.16541]|uniref:YtrH family sporulation protein n=1 Tax=Bacillus sp. CGMCC 1.16541 TaxID=2185143 RepID=UPI000D7395CD|nr:YtrH family sporulation protein [Bacillus sp. CGMCC 1.16541]
MKEPFMTLFIWSYFTSLGIILGGSLIGAFGGFLVGKPPLYTMYILSNSLKIWAIVGAIGGTFDTFYSFERGLFEGATKDVFKQILLILVAMGGAQTGSIIIRWLTQEHLGT